MSRLHLVVALEAEARPLVEHLGLEAVAAAPWRLWRGEGSALVASGIGKVAAAAATAHLAAVARTWDAGRRAQPAATADGNSARAAAGRGEGRRPDVWLNVGLGGHPSAALGSGWLAHKVTDAGSGRSWYPPLVFPPPGAMAAVITVDRPETGYPADAVYEMEAAGFFAAAGRLAPLELVHAYKVISDNREQPAERRPAAAAVAERIAGRLGEIDRLLAALGELAGELARLDAEPPELECFLARCRFTVSQERRLRRLLGRWTAAAGGAPAWDGELARHRRAADLLAALERRLDAHVLQLGGEREPARPDPGEGRRPAAPAFTSATAPAAREGER